MSALRYVARVVIVAAICVIATMWVGWLSLPVIGFIYGVVDQRAYARGSIAAIGAILGWCAILATEAARGADVRMVAMKVGEVMQLPAFALIFATLAFGALLCGTAAVLGSAFDLT